MKPAIQQISNFIKDMYQIDISKYDEVFLYKSIKKRLQVNKFENLNQYYTFLDNNSNEAESLFKSLQNSYSEFFRNPLTYIILERYLLPLMLMEKSNYHRKELRIWSAACAAGQEVYSLAMILEELIIGRPDKLNYRINATDKSEYHINLAIKGEYSEDLLDNVKLKRIKKWFTVNSTTYSIIPELKKKINFSVFDLFSENNTFQPPDFGGFFDLVICSNLLFYYEQDFRNLIILKIIESMNPDGYFICGESERDILMKYDLVEIFPNSAIFKLK